MGAIHEIKKCKNFRDTFSNTTIETVFFLPVRGQGWATGEPSMPVYRILFRAPYSPKEIGSVTRTNPHHIYTKLFCVLAGGSSVGKSMCTCTRVYLCDYLIGSQR